MSSTPPGWPLELEPPSGPDWARYAVLWLLDECPPDFRSYPLLRQQPVVLSWLAVRHHVALQETYRQNLAAVRSDLADALDPRTINAAVELLEQQLAHQVLKLRAVRLVAEALGLDQAEDLA